ncbi:MAG: DUF2911 domain-containing protein [Gemmatimonadaceae bacterium]
MTAKLLRIAAVLLVTALPSVARSQGYPFSERGSVTQMIAYTNVSVWYGRPIAHGRALFGALVPWDSVWHPGADSATRIRFSHDVLVEGKPLRAGDYSLWVVPREHSPWTVIFSRAAHVFHKPYPGARFEVLRVDVVPDTVSYVESLAIYFPSVIRDKAVMRLHWGAVAVPIRIVAPFLPHK